MLILQGVKKAKLPHCSRKIEWNKYSTTTVPEKVENSEVTYPEILDLSEIAVELRKKQKYYEKIKKLNTIEEKLLALNLPKYYGWPAFHIQEGFIPYNYMPFAQFITRTEIKEVETLPVYRDDGHTKSLLASIKDELGKALVFENCYKNYRHEVQTIVKEEDQTSNIEAKEIKINNIIYQINSVLQRVLLSQCPHSLKASVDYEPRLEAFWRVGGFYPTTEDKKLRESKAVNKERLDEYIDRCIQYFGRPVLQLRSNLPLPVTKLKESNKEIIWDPKDVIDNEINNEDVSDLVVKKESSNFVNYPLQEYRYNPKIYLEIPRERVTAAVVPGFWPNDPFKFGILSYHSTGFMSEREVYDSTDSREALHCQAVLASYAWLYGQACYQGFSTFYDVTYPFVTQTILTDGKAFSFYQYQMNTTVLHSNATDSTNPLKNECYATLSEELYHEIVDSQIIGWNDKVLLHLISMYMNTPKNRPGVNLSPYLHNSEKLVSNIKEDKKRMFLHNCYQYMTSHRPRHRSVPEIYDWERIYKIENKRRVLDARKRFFEQFLDPINDRKLNEHPGAYIPKKFREPGKEKKKLAETFYPDAFPDYHEIV